jgi:hypothetical protein
MRGKSRRHKRLHVAKSTDAADSRIRAGEPPKWRLLNERKGPSTGDPWYKAGTLLCRFEKPLAQGLGGYERLTGTVLSEDIFRNCGVDALCSKLVLLDLQRRVSRFLTSDAPAGHKV